MEAPLRTIECMQLENAITNVQMTNEFNTKLSSLLASNSFLQMMEKSLTYYLNLSIYTKSMNETIGQISEIGTVDSAKFISKNNEELNATKRFFRIGVTEVK